MANVNVSQGQEVKYLKYLPQYMYYIEKVFVLHPSIYLVLKIYKQFDFTAAILLNGGCEGQIKVRCEMFDIYLKSLSTYLYTDAKITTLSIILYQI